MFLSQGFVFKYTLKNFINIIMYKLHEPLAQLVEHLTFNQRVEGSSPSWLTIFLRVWRNWQTR